jgi:hypothetical protein
MILALVLSVLALAALVPTVASLLRARGRVRRPRAAGAYPAAWPPLPRAARPPFG